MRHFFLQYPLFYRSTEFSNWHMSLGKCIFQILEKIKPAFEENIIKSMQLKFYPFSARQHCKKKYIYMYLKLLTCQYVSEKKNGNFI